MDSAGNYGTAACTALAIYEHFLTLDKEVRTVWQRPLKVNAASILLTLNRYAVLLYLFISIVDVDPDLGCTSSFIIQIGSQICYMVILTTFGTFAALRICALWNRNIWLLLAVLIVGLIPTMTNLYSLTQIRLVNDPIEGICLAGSIIPINTANSLALATRVAAIAVDLAVLLLTFVKLRAHWRVSSASNANIVGHLILRNGCLSFTVLLLMNFAEIILVHFAGQAFVTTYIVVITSILESRFIMDLLDIRSRSSLSLTPPNTITNPRRGSTHDGAVSGFSTLISDFSDDFSHGSSLYDKDSSDPSDSTFLD